MVTVIECPDCTNFMNLEYSDSQNIAYLNCHECDRCLDFMRQYRHYPPEELLDIIDEDIVLWS